MNEKMPSEAPIIGIPEGLMLFEQKQLWKDFFEKLGYRVLLSGHTTNRVLEAGIARCCNETCLPVKVFTGHAASLCKKADYVFIPRYSRICLHEKSCPKFCGLPDEIRLSLKNEICPIEVAIDFDRDFKKTYESLKVLSRKLGQNAKTVEKAFDEIVMSGLTAEESPNRTCLENSEKPMIAVLGHPYMIFDELLSMNLINKLKAAGYCVRTPYDVRRSVRRNNVNPFLSGSFFDTGLDILGGAKALLGLPGLIGMIYLSPFACGIDSLVTEFIEHRLRKERQIPYLKLTVDEHSGEAGFDTRLEAFLDMLANVMENRRKEIV